MDMRKDDFEYLAEATNKLSTALQAATREIPGLNRIEVKFRRDDVFQTPGGNDLVALILAPKLNDAQKLAIVDNITEQTGKSSRFPPGVNRLVIENGKLEDVASIDSTELKQAIESATSQGKSGFIR